MRPEMPGRVGASSGSSAHRVALCEPARASPVSRPNWSVGARNTLRRASLMARQIAACLLHESLTGGHHLSHDHNRITEAVERFDQPRLSKIEGSVSAINRADRPPGPLWLGYANANPVFPAASRESVQTTRLTLLAGAAEYIQWLRGAILVGNNNKRPLPPHRCAFRIDIRPLQEIHSLWLY
jgi:hypothetical protein